MRKIKMPSLIAGLKQKKILVQFFMVFCLLIIVPVAVTNNLNYFNSSKVIENEINQYNDQILENMIEYLDTKLWKICNDVLLAADADSIDTVFKRGNASGQAILNKYDVTNIREGLKSLKKTDTIIDEASIYFLAQDAIVSNDGYYDTESYFSSKKRFDSISASGWKEILSQKHAFEFLNSSTVHEKTLNSDIQSNAITLLSTIPGYSDPKATFMVFINQNSIKNIISEYSGIKNNDYFITDSSGNSIAKLANNSLVKESNIKDIVAGAANSKNGITHKTINGGELSVTCAISPLTNWVFITIAPLKDIYSQSIYIRNTTIIICVVCMLLGLLVSVLLSKRMYRPISNIMDYISNADASEPDNNKKVAVNTNEYKLIIEHLDKILNDNKSLKNSLDEDKPFLSDNLFYRILHNSISSEDDVLQSMEKLGINFGKEYFIVASVKLDMFNMDENGKYFKSDVLDISEKIMDIIYSMISRKFKCYQVNEGIHSSLIVNFNADEEDAFMSLCEEIGRFFDPDEYKQRVSMGIGVKCTDISLIYKSYNQSVLALSYITFSKGSQVIVYDENQMNSYSKLFDTNIDLNPVYNSLLAGESEKGAMLACRIIDDCAEKKFPYQQMNKIAILMIHTAISVLDIKGYSLADTKLDKNQIYKCVESFVLADEYKQHITNVFESIGELISSRYNRRKSEIVNYITKYVNENYSKDIYLDSIADELNMSTNYLSHFFKDITGVGFPDYLGRVRVEKAKKLLESTDKPIGEISTEVGCMNINTFIRLFKKAEGITPGRYREALMGIKDEQ